MNEPMNEFLAYALILGPLIPYLIIGFFIGWGFVRLIQFIEALTNNLNNKNNESENENDEKVDK